jgi:mannose-6-phosphate isomerase-like protein (cupin superfamily)
MKKADLKDFIKGWFVGNFDPSLIKTNDVEVAIKRYKAGDYESSHYHKVATEITVIVSGTVLMNNTVYCSDDIIVIEPNDKTDFKCISDVITVVVKYPGANDDKYVD